MAECVFCQIAQGQLLCFKVYEDADFLGFLDIRPRTKGHTLIIPKAHYRWTWEVPNFGDYWEVAKKVATSALKGLDAEWLMFVTFGWQVHHAHIQIIPRYLEDAGEELPVVITKGFSKSEMQAIADKIVVGSR